MTVARRLKIAVVLEDVEYILNRGGPFVVVVVPGDGFTAKLAVVRRGLGQEFQSSLVSLEVQDQLEPALVVVEVRLAANAKQLLLVHVCHVLKRGVMATVAPQVLV